MPATIPNPVKLALTTALQDLTAAVGAAKVRSYDVRVANIGAADAYVDLVMTDGVTIIYRAKNYPVPYQQAGSAVDLELKLLVPTGWKLQAKASANATLEASAVSVEADTANFA